jgi:hypothetical protein
LYILMFRFSDNRREDKRFWTEWQKAFPEFNPLLISYWIKFWFITALSEYSQMCRILTQLIAISYVMILPWKTAKFCFNL